MSKQGPPFCDFCSSPDVCWAYEADDFTMGELGGVTHESIGAWAACQACHDLIEAGDLHNLTERSLTQYEAIFGDAVPKEIRTALAQVHIRFAHAQRGEAKPV